LVDLLAALPGATRNSLFLKGGCRDADASDSQGDAFHGGLTRLVPLRKYRTVEVGVLPACMEEVPGIAV